MITNLATKPAMNLHQNPVLIQAQINLNLNLWKKSYLTLHLNLRTKVDPDREE